MEPKNCNAIVLSLFCHRRSHADPDRPTVPVMMPVLLKDCMEELLKFTLTSSMNGEIDVGLSKDYCSRLLEDDPSNPFSSSIDIFRGVPSYPLYKHLAASLYQSISSGALVSMAEKISSMLEDRSLKLKEDEWTKLIIEKGSKMLDILKAVDFELHVQEPFFSELKDGRKTVEGRCANGSHNCILRGALILFNKCLLLQVQDVHRYASFLEMLQAESLQRVLPGVTTYEEGVHVYRQFYTEEKESLNGVLAICVTKSTSSLHNLMAAMLLGLRYTGIQRLLNMGCTEGTIPEALPPQTSVLVSSFLALHNPQVKGSALTSGARALAKHVNRCSDKYWGDFCGSDSDKNKAALDIISRFIVHCCWMNMHVVTAHSAVFEIRVAEGFGARWSEDGSKFVGFLEPYIVDGHSKKWKH
ncbi:hypothetical protein M9H77_30137 [Catharanthus roseus]|uniref:Uncharacterized protein n=1 Tax=Catharanthus roseus TaxID=4058 RepID=A0ACB9ZXF9_CATRO|nr:hypothetical protein M9H77_30137 [Catharanthus roseus]